MKTMIRFIFVVCALLLLNMATGCSSNGYSGGSTTYSSHRNAWGYDNYYRSGVNRNYERSATRARAASTGRAGRSGGGGGGRGGRR